MKARAPKWPSAGFQFVDVRNRRPSCRKAGIASLVVENRMRPSTTRTRNPEARQIQRKVWSARRDPPWSGPFGAPGRGCASGGLVVLGVAIKWRSTGNDQLVELGDRLLLDVVGQLGVVDAGGHVLAVGVDVLQERLQVRALGVVGLVLVGDDPRRRRDRVGGVAVGPQ